MGRGKNLPAGQPRKGTNRKLCYPLLTQASHLERKLPAPVHAAAIAAFCLGKSFDDAIASVLAGVNSYDWQIMCVKWNTSDEQERMIQLSTPSLDSESGSTPISAEEAFVSVMGKDRSGRIRCVGSRETRRTWYGTGEGSSSTDYQQQISNIENTLRMEVEELHTEARRRDSEMDEMRRELKHLRKRESEMDDIRRQMLQMSTFMTQFQTSQRFAASAPPRVPEDDHRDTDAEGDDYDDDDD
ncbi:hypothetical protein Taro_033457 [Colocasia esculenta]|uniref:Uncharacterized protein n=1 Tax=Colocasia esculenta TaxID=4460 RepID=A0A843W717_COLES|nr:hypothetical protein [Colocasia esculenta]